MPGGEGGDAPGPEEQRRLTDFVRRAGSAFFEAAGRSKDDLLRAATGEIRSWLDHLDLDKELVRALSRMTLEVKAEIRFRPSETGLSVETRSANVSVRRDGDGK